MAGDGPGASGKPEPKIGSYRLIQPLGAGGMSSVYRAMHEESGLEVALKVLPRAFAKNPTTMQRFLREAKSAEALEHPGIVAIYDHGSDQGRHYLVLEYVSGGDLHDRIRTQGPMSIAEAVDAIYSVAESLQFAETRGLIHRDIKPANLLLTAEGKVKVADLGLALRSSSEDERVTREGTTVGTVDYMAPEQARDSRATSIKSDMYSLGCTFFFLLTGQPPYPGGDVADKLTRHCTGPLPEPRDFRADLPDDVRSVLLQMIAKRPEQRFEDYASLLRALAATRTSSESSAEGSTLTLAPTPFFAADEEDQDAKPGTEPVRLPMPPLIPRRIDLEESSIVSLDSLSLADASDLADLEEAPQPPRRVTPIAALRVFDSARAKRPQAAPEPPELQAFDPELDDSMEVAPRPVSDRPMTDAERTWILTCVLIGLAAILIIIGADQLFRGGSSRNDDLIISAIETFSDPADSEANVLMSPAPNLATKAAGVGSNRPGQVANPRPPAPAWVEPKDPTSEIRTEVPFSQELQAEFLPGWIKEAAPTGLGGRTIKVFRLADMREADERPTIRSGLDVAGGSTLEVVSNGPFFESDLRFVGESRLIRAAPGQRPIINIEAPRVDLAFKQPAFLDLGEKDLVLEGLDLIVNVSQLSKSQTALFSARGGSITLRDCSITIVNRGGQPFTIFKSEASSQSTRILIERSMIRGAFSSLVTLGPGSADLALVRSLIFNRQGNVIVDAGQGAVASERRVWVVRSLLASGGSMLVRSSAISPSSRKSILIRAIGSTFAHFQSGQPASLISSTTEAGPLEIVDWKGEANDYQGWKGFVSGVAPSGSQPTVLLNGLDAARQVFVSTDRTSVESSQTWPAPVAPDHLQAEQLIGLAEPRASILQSLPKPSPTLHEQTVEVFNRPSEPRLKPSLGNGESASPGPAEQAITPGRSSTSTVSSNGTDEGQQTSERSATGSRDLHFEADAPRQDGDLGRFLSENLREGDRNVRVFVHGSGNRYFSPLVLPEGLSLEILVEGRPGATLPSWTVLANSNTHATAAIRLKGGSLRLVGLRLNLPRETELTALIAVEHGSLAVERCRLTDLRAEPSSQSSLLEFDASGTQPLSATEPKASVFLSPDDRPVCWVSESILRTTGDGIQTEIGRALVWVRQSVLIAGNDAIALRLSKVARKRFDGTIVLDRCTLSAENAFVRLGEGTGSLLGPDRPCLIFSENCAFLGNFEKGTKDSTLLKANRSSFASGALFWQSSGDAYLLPNFVGREEGEPLIPIGKRLDVRWQWVDLWGESHAKRAIGPRNGSQAPLRLFAKLRPGEVQPADLLLYDDLSNVRTNAGSQAGADLQALGIQGPDGSGRRR